jgi:hypothetical protein
MGVHARANAPPASGQCRPQGAGSAQRGQRGPSSHGSAARHEAHSGSLARATGDRHATQAGGASRAPATASQSCLGGSAIGTGACWPTSRHGAAPALRQSARMAADTSWTFEPGAILLIAILGGLYLPRWRRVRRVHGPREAPVVRLLSYTAGLALLIVALLSPVDRLADQAFTMHMVQHVLLLDLAPIALICGLTKVIM